MISVSAVCYVSMLRCFSWTESITKTDTGTFAEEQHFLDGPLHCDYNMLKPGCLPDTSNEFQQNILAEASIGLLRVDVRQRACRDGFTLVSAVWSPEKGQCHNEKVGLLRRQSPTTTSKNIIYGSWRDRNKIPLQTGCLDQNITALVNTAIHQLS